MQILVIGRTFPNEKTGSVGLFEYQQAQALNKSNNSVIYGFIDNQSIKVHTQVKKVSRMENTLPIYGYYLPIGGLPHNIYDAIKFKLFKRLLKKIISIHGDIDIIHFHFPLLTLNNSIINYLLENKIKFVVTEHWSKVLLNKLNNHEEKLLVKILNKSDAVIVVSEMLKKSILEYVELLNIRKIKKIYVIPNIINPSYEYIPKIANKEFNLVSIGRLEKSKKNDLIIKAIEFLNLPHINLYIIGDGKERKELQSLSKKLRLDNNIHFMGTLNSEEIKEVFQSATAYITASEFETFGVPAVESLVMGRPVILGNNHPISSKISNKNGYIYDYKNREIRVNNIAKAILEVSHTIYEFEAISLDAQKQYSVESTLEDIINIYINLRFGEN